MKLRLLGKVGARESSGSFWGRQVIRLILILWSLIVLFPMIWVFYTSFKSNQEFFADPWALPQEWKFDNYIYAWTESNFSSYFLNSLLVTVLAAVLTVLMSTALGYILAKYRFKGVRMLEKSWMVLMMVPQVLLLIPLFFQCMSWNMTDNLYTLALLYALREVPFSVFIVTGFIRGIHNSLLEAAVMDGANEFHIFFKLIMPLSKSSILIMVLLSVMGSWNEYVMALTFLSSPEKYTVPIGIEYLVSGSTYNVNYGGMFAGLVLAMAPILVIYAIFQKQFAQGLSVDAGIKG